MLNRFRGAAMKLKFKIQQYQSNAVDAVLDCFAGQPKSDALRYRIDPGQVKKGQHYRSESEYEGFKNDDIRLTDVQLLDNIQAVQKRQNLPLSKSLADFTETDRKGVVKPKQKIL